MRSGAWLLALTSCGGGGGISPNDPLQDLEDGGVSEVCQDLIDTYQDFDAAGACTTLAVLVSLDPRVSITPSDCRLAALYCANQFGNQVLDPEGCAQSLGDAAAGCDATVGDLEVCVQFYVDATSSLFGSVSCDDVGDDAALQDVEDQLLAIQGDQPAGCAAVRSCLGNLLPF